MSECSAQKMPLSQKIGFVGGGQMALALAKGFIAAKLIASEQILVSAPSDRNLKTWRDDMKCLTTHDNAKVIRECDIIFLSTKPHIFTPMLRNIHEGLEPDSMLTLESKLFVSIMAGIQMKTLAGKLKTIAKSPRIIRVHPNTPAMVGTGCSVISIGEGANDGDAKVVKQLLTSVGLCEQVPEYQQDAFTGMAGSGPAYIYTIIEALSDGGVRMGLPRDLATQFAAQMTMGAAKMVLESGKHPGQLKDEVTSPGGTTIRALQVMERGGIRGIMMDAVQASAERATELGAK